MGKTTFVLVYYSDSEAKIGYALSGVRKHVVLATKSGGSDKKTALEHLEQSLKQMRTDWIDILQLHNPGALPDPGDPDSPYSALVEAKKKGMIRFLGISSHKLTLAGDAVRSGLYDTVQFPLSLISSQEDLQLTGLCKQQDTGLIAMKPLCGGLVRACRPLKRFLIN